MGNISLFLISSVLFVNGLALLGKADSKGTGVLNLLVGGLVVITALYSAADQGSSDQYAYLRSAGALLFGFTYLWVGVSYLLGFEWTALGWFCLWVAIAAVPFAIAQFVLLDDPVFGIFWLIWGFLWYLFFRLMALRESSITVPVGYFTIAISFATVFWPGILLLTDKWYT